MGEKQINFIKHFKDKVILLVGLIITMSGLFLPWVRIEWKSSSGVSDLTGIIIFSILIYLLTDKKINSLNVWISGAVIGVLMGIQFINFPRILYITSERSFQFSADYVQAGFFITLLGVIIVMAAGFLERKKNSRP